MARAPKKTPGIGHNGGLPEHADIRSALAMEMIFEEKEKALRDQKKKARLRLVEGKGITQDDLKFMKELRDKTDSEVVDIFKRRWHTIGAVYQNPFEQMDLFTKKSDAPTRAAYYTMGLIAGLQGKDFEPPPMVVGDDRQQMLDGHNEGRERRSAAEQDMLAEALDPKNEGKVADGTAAAVNDRAAADFAKDQGGDPLVVNGEKYATIRQANAARKRLEAQGGGAPTGNQAGSPAGDQEGYLNDLAPVVGDDVQLLPSPSEASQEPEASPASSDAPSSAPTATEESSAVPAPAKRPVARPDFHSWDDDWDNWTAAQTMEFRRWFESLPEDVTPAVTHPGAVTYFNLLREERENRRISEQREEDDAAFEAEPPKVQAAELPDEAAIAAGAKALQENGFVPAKRQRKPR